jgi:hypothetical protein
MDRAAAKRRIAVLAALVLATVSAVGCQSLFFTAAYLIKGLDVPADFKELKGKKVAVVCRATPSLSYGAPNVSRDLAQQITLLLQEQVPKIKTIDQRKIVKWTDENTWEEFAEVGKALKADMVVGVDLESFSIYQGQTLYQGKANASIRVFDCSKTGNGKEVYHTNIPQCIYPPNMPIPASDRTEPEFRREFVIELANQIGRHFYSHDPHADFGKDADALK